MSIARAKPSRELSATRPCRSCAGANAIECSSEVEPAPAFADGVEHRLHRAGLLDVERHRDRRVELARQRLDVRSRLVVQPGHGELGAAGAEHARAAVGDAVLVRDADHQALAAAEQRPMDVHALGNAPDGRTHRRAAAPEGGAAAALSARCRPERLAHALESSAAPASAVMPDARIVLQPLEQREQALAVLALGQQRGQRRDRLVGS